MILLGKSQKIFSCQETIKFAFLEAASDCSGKSTEERSWNWRQENKGGVNQGGGFRVKRSGPFLELPRHAAEQDGPAMG